MWLCARITIILSLLRKVKQVTVQRGYSRNATVQESFPSIILAKTYQISLHLIMDNVHLEKPCHLRRYKVGQWADHIKNTCGIFQITPFTPSRKIFSEGAPVSYPWVTDLSWIELKEWLKATDLDRNVNSGHLWKLELWVTLFFFIMSFWVFRVMNDVKHSQHDASMSGHWSQATRFSVWLCGSLAYANHFSPLGSPFHLCRMEIIIVPVSKSC